MFHYKILHTYKTNPENPLTTDHKSWIFTYQMFTSSSSCHAGSLSGEANVSDICGLLSQVPSSTPESSIAEVCEHDGTSGSSFSKSEPSPRTSFSSLDNKAIWNYQLQQYKAVGSCITQRDLPTGRRHNNSYWFLVTIFASIYITSSYGSNNTYLCSSRLASSPKGHIFVISGFSFLFFFGTQLSAYLSFCCLFLLALPFLCITLLNVSILN